MVVFDASVLLFVFNENTRASVPKAKERVDFLVKTLSDAGEKIIVPTPALSECLVHAGPAGADYLAIMHKQGCFRVVSFDERAAIEAAVRTYQARQGGVAKGGNPAASKAKIKFDRQIVAIALVEGATAIYSDDDHVCVYAKEAGIESYRLADLPLPPEDPQRSLFDEESDEKTDGR
jgi:predicted nucleic acid-binding protein